MNNNELDRMLDQALSEYRDAEPLSGMEDRILRRIAAQPQASPRRWAWILATAAVVVVVAAALWLGMRPRPHQQTVATKVTQPAQQPTTSTARVETPEARVPHPFASLRAGSTGREAEAASAAARRESTKANPRAVQSVATKPVFQQFPAPAPMTTEEHALLALARTHPDALLAQSDDTDKLKIAPIDIKPLAPESGAPEGEQE